jgi:hypothetical protein
MKEKILVATIIIGLIWLGCVFPWLFIVYIIVGAVSFLNS